MGVKSTTQLSRQAAEEKYVEFKMRQEKTQRKYRAKAAKMSNKDLEDKLENLNDEHFHKHYGSDGGFDNFYITDHQE